MIIIISNRRPCNRPQRPTNTLATGRRAVRGRQPPSCPWSQVDVTTQIVALPPSAGGPSHQLWRQPVSWEDIGVPEGGCRPASRRPERPRAGGPASSPRPDAMPRLRVRSHATTPTATGFATRGRTASRGASFQLAGTARGTRDDPLASAERPPPPADPCRQDAGATKAAPPTLVAPASSWQVPPAPPVTT